MPAIIAVEISSFDGELKTSALPDKLSNDPVELSVRTLVKVFPYTPGDLNKFQFQFQNRYRQ